MNRSPCATLPLPQRPWQRLPPDPPLLLFPPPTKAGAPPAASRGPWPSPPGGLAVVPRGSFHGVHLPTSPLRPPSETRARPRAGAEAAEAGRRRPPTPAGPGGGGPAEREDARDSARLARSGGRPGRGSAAGTITTGRGEHGARRGAKARTAARGGDRGLQGSRGQGCVPPRVCTSSHRRRGAGDGSQQRRDRIRLVFWETPGDPSPTLLLSAGLSAGGLAPPPPPQAKSLINFEVPPAAPRSRRGAPPGSPVPRSSCRLPVLRQQVAPVRNRTALQTSRGKCLQSHQMTGSFGPGPRVPFGDASQRPTPRD